MKSRKLLLALGLAATALGGCAAYPYDDPYAYNNGYYNNGYYGYPSYYTGPSVGFGVTYVDRDGHYYRDHRDRHWDRDGDGHRDR